MKLLRRKFILHTIASAMIVERIEIDRRFGCCNPADIAEVSALLDDILKRGDATRIIEPRTGKVWYSLR